MQGAMESAVFFPAVDLVEPLGRSVVALLLLRLQPASPDRNCVCLYDVIAVEQQQFVFVLENQHSLDGSLRRDWMRFRTQVASESKRRQNGTDCQRKNCFLSSHDRESTGSCTL
jgi:hypothetical protein